MKTTRKELFDKAWELPMTKLAKEFGCSDVGLRKACIKNKIPLPPAGHWQKILYGKGYEKPGLPFPDLNPEITISPQAIKAAKKAHEESTELEQLVKNNSNPRIVPSKNLNDAHPLVAATIKMAQDYQRRITYARKHRGYGYAQLGSENWPPYEDKGRFSYSPREGCLPITVSFHGLERALRIVDPLLKALELSGFNISIPHAERHDPHELVFIKDGEKIQIYMREGYSRTTLSPKAQSLAKNHDIYTSKTENFANGLLYIEVKINDIYRSQTFKDLKKVSLEEQMDLVFQYILDAPQKAKDMRVEREKEEKEREDRREIRRFNDNILKSQERQYEKALAEIHLYKQLQELKDYIALLQTHISSFTEKERSLANFWIQIVQKYANDADPITNRLEQLKAIANEPEDKYDNYWCKKAKKYIPHEEDEWDEEYDDY